MASIYEDLQNNPNAIFTIAGSNFSVSGLLIGDGLTLGSNIEYNTPLESALTETISGYFKKYGAVAAALGGKTTGIYSLKSVAQTIKTWVGTQINPITLKARLVATKDGDNVLEKLQDIHRYIMPTFVGTGVKNATIMRAPGGASFTTSKDGNLVVTGTLTVSIGKWFRASGQVIDNANFDISYVVTQNEKPLYVDGSITFSPYKAISLRDFRDYFRFPVAESSV